MRRSHRVGHGVIEVAELGGLVAAGEPTRQVAAADELTQGPRRGVARLRPGVAGVADRSGAGITPAPNTYAGGAASGVGRDAHGADSSAGAGLVGSAVGRSVVA